MTCCAYLEIYRTYSFDDSDQLFLSALFFFDTVKTELDSGSITSNIRALFINTQ